MKLLAFLGIFVPWAAGANPHEQEIQRALIQRDQQAAEFAAGVNGSSLQSFHHGQWLNVAPSLHPDPAISKALRPYERARMAREREAFVLRLPPPRVRGPDPGLSPLPLPGGPRHGVEPVPSQRVGG